MIHVFCNKRGSGKTKALISLANDKILETKGDVVYIDDDRRHLFDLDRRIRFISTDEYKIKDYNCFYGFLCGIFSENYDVNTVFIDGLFNIVRGNFDDAAHLFFELERLANEYKIDFFISINNEEHEMPEYIKKYVA